ncbi:MAG TPA: DUF805 domain-containing protein [Burkholderiales bacterium]|nr:DUF805 domain-containing protein [Burkholderiales bacterium]
MPTANPYTAPKAAVGDMDEQEYQPIKTFSAAGRIGRARYIGYSIGYALLVGLCAGVIAAATGKAGGGAIGMLVIFAAYAALIVVQMLLTIQRCHDFNTSGWVSLLILIPLVNLLFWFIPGTDGPNRFGAPPPPNTTGTIVLALILPAVFMVGIVAAVAIPAYQTYAQRAHLHQQ